MTSVSKRPLPGVGSAFAFPLGDGRFSACRVLLVSGDEDRVLVAGSAWIGDQVPDAGEPALRPILHLDHRYAGGANIIWVVDQPPPNLIPIGVIEPTPDEQAISCGRFGDWSWVAIQPLLQWRWDNEREAVLAEVEVKRREDAAAQAKAWAERADYLAKVTLEELRSRRFFADWTYPPPRAIHISREIMTRTVAELIRLGPEAPEADRMAILKQCIESFNANETGESINSYIETDEREDIIEEFEAIVHACGLGAHEDLADRWRDW